MKQMTIPKNICKATPLLGAVALSAIALLGVPKPADAATLCGGPGVDNWVDTCPPGVDKFPLSIAMLEVQLGSTPPVTLNLTGPATVTRKNPVDALINDPDFANVDVGFGLGNVGRLNQPSLHPNGVIKTQLKERFQGTLGGQGITLTGRGVGAIIKATEYPNLSDFPQLATSFFLVSAEIKSSLFGQARNFTSIRVDPDRWLQGVPPDVIPGKFPPPPLPVTPNPGCNSGSMPSTIIYCGFSSVDFFKVNKQGKFIDAQGNVITDPRVNGVKVATLRSEKHIVPPSGHPKVPEPSTAIPSLLVGLAAMWGLRKKQQVKEG
ncbi:MAG: PEP-CTERM sorting domain-containing protein [Microcystaceae cyanobacterium]